MDSFWLDRHFKLWEENNKLIKRVVFLTIVLALAIVVKVLVPFVDHSQDKGPILQKIGALTAERSEVNERLEMIQRTEKVLEDVSRLISAQPWQDEKESLIRRYQRMREGHTREEYQQEADETIRNIAGMLRQDIVEPLRKGAGGAQLRGRDLNRLNTEILSLSNFIEDWEREHIGKRWYATLDMKERAMMGLSQDLNRRLEAFSSFIDQEVDTVQRARQAVDQQLRMLNTQIDSEGSRLDDLEEELQGILPQWMRGLLETYEVIQLLPVLLLAAAAYVLAVGINLTRHYRRYVEGKGIDEAITAVPAMSSTWTLIPRGGLGTALTLVAYTLFFLAVWALLERSMNLLLEWLAIDASRAWIGQQNVWQGFLWFSRLAFLAFIGYVIVMPWRKKS